MRVHTAYHQLHKPWEDVKVFTVHSTCSVPSSHMAGVSKLSVTTVPGNSMFSPGLCRKQAHIHTRIMCVIMDLKTNEAKYKSIGVTKAD